MTGLSGHATDGPGGWKEPRALAANNSFQFGVGGLVNSGTVRITHSRFTGNGAGEGVAGLFAGGTVFITNTTFDHNRGGPAITSGGTLVVADSAFIENTFDSNVPSRIGEGIGISENSTAVVTDTTFTRNLGSNGTAIANSGSLILINSTLADNIGFDQMFVGSALSSAMSATTILVNTVRNIVGAGSHVLQADCAGPVTSLGNNLIGDPTGCTIILQPSDLTGDAGLGTFKDNGRPGNGHFPLLPTSPAIDAGNDAVCSRTDQLGHRRIGPCDIGAIAFRDRDDRRREEGDNPQTEQDAAAAVAQPDISGLVANLVQAVTTLKSASAVNDDIFNQIKSVSGRADALARGSVSEATSEAK